MVKIPILCLSVVALVFLSLVGCKIQIDVPKGGNVITESGKYECLSGQACTIDVYDVLYDETFVALPDQGYSFVGWEKRDKGLCGGKAKPCWLPTTGFLGHDRLLAILESDTVFYLTPQFGRGSSACSFEFQEINDARFSTIYLTREVTTGPLCEGSIVGIGSVGEGIAQYSLDGGTWTDDTSDIHPGQTIRVRLISAATYDTARQATLTIGEPECFLFYYGCIWVLTGGTSEFKVTTQSGNPADAPQVIVTHPMDGQEVSTSVLQVTGTATDDDGVLEILVNGISASSQDGFLTWQADVQLHTGQNSLVVESADELLNRNPQAASLDIENSLIVFKRAVTIAMENNAGHLYVVDMESGNVVAVDTQTDEWSVVSSNQETQVPFISPRRIVVDQAQTQAWILDRGYQSIIAVNLLTGGRALFKGEGEPLEDMRDLALDEKNGQLLALLSDSGPTTSTTIRSGRIVSIDLGTGMRRLLSDNTKPTGEPEFYYTYSLLYDNVRDRLIVLQFGNILSVDPVSGRRQTLVDYRGLSPGAATIDERGDRIIVGRSPRGVSNQIFELLEVDLETGTFTPIKIDVFSINGIADIVFDWRENRLFYYYGHVGTLDLDTGEDIYSYY